MFSDVIRYFSDLPIPELARDLLDILITYYIFYRVSLVLKGTRAMQVGVGLVAIFVLYVVAQLLRLHTVLTLLGAVLSSAILIGVVVFQSDIRRGLMRMGAGARFGSGQNLEAKVIDAVVDAATILARHRIGAIVTFEQDANLDEFVGSHQGHVLDAAVSSELLVSLFIPEGMNKLHDGAVVIRDLRVAKAGVFFPLPEGRVSDASFGSRHRAAMGITEETDAVVIVVSEERGSISFCFNGNIVPNLDGPRLRAALDAVFAPKRKERRTGRFARWFRSKRPPPDRISSTPLLIRQSADAPASSKTPQRLPEVQVEPPESTATPKPLRRKVSVADQEEGKKRIPQESDDGRDSDARPTAIAVRLPRSEEPVVPLRKNPDKKAPEPDANPQVEPEHASEDEPATRRTSPLETPEPARPMPRAEESARLVDSSFDGDRPSSEGLPQ